MANEVEVLEPESVVEETVQPVETSETPASDAVPAPVEGTTDAAALAARTRDEKGRFAPKTDGSPAPDGVIPVPAPATTPAAVVSSPPPVSDQPFVVRGDGQKHGMPGSTLDANGDLHVKAEHVATYRQLIAEGIAHRGSWRQREADFKQQIEQASAVEKARADKYNHAAVFLFDKVNDPSWLQALVNDPERELALLRRELGLELKTRDIDAPRAAAPSTVAPEVNEQETEQAARSMLEEEVEMLLESPLARSVYTTDEREAVMKRYQRRIGAYFVQHEGGPALDRHALKEDFEDELNQRKATRDQLSATAKAKEFNDKRNAPAAPIPPVVSTKGPGGNASAPKKFANREEYNKAMGLN